MHQETLYTAALTPHLARIRGMLAGLPSSPQVLLFEGGTERERQSLARWWSAVQHCTATPGIPGTPGASSVETPCLVCAPCQQIAAQVHLDTLAFDGRISNKDDEENPGPVRALTIDNVRALKATLATPPYSGLHRVVILCGLEGERREAANALLKVLEEPTQSAIFVILTPMRVQILATLVSRSCVLTLPWPSADRDADRGADTDLTANEPLRALTQGLADMMTTQRGWWHLTTGKGAVDPPLAEAVLLACRRTLTQALRGQSTGMERDTGLRQCFAALTPGQALIVGRLLDESQEALRSHVGPARVLDMLAVGLTGIENPSFGEWLHPQQVAPDG